MLKELLSCYSRSCIHFYGMIFHLLMLPKLQKVLVEFDDTLKKPVCIDRSSALLEIYESIAYISLPSLMFSLSFLTSQCSLGHGHWQIKDRLSSLTNNRNISLWKRKRMIKEKNEKSKWERGHYTRHHRKFMASL